MNALHKARLPIYSVILATMFIALLWFSLKSPVALATIQQTNFPRSDSTDSQQSPVSDSKIYLPLILHRYIPKSDQPRTGEVEIRIALQSATGMPDTVYNGEVITYTITVTNHSNLIVDGVIENILPSSGLVNITCGCEQVITTTPITDPSEGKYEITSTTKLRWNNILIGSTTTQQFVFNATVYGKSNGSILNNRAVFIFSYNSTNPESGLVNADLRAIVRARSNLQNVGLSAVPSWVSDEPGATTALDWGDFDLDGDLDLALATTSEVAVYRNNNGQLEPYWRAKHRILDLKWISMGAGEPLGLVVVGEEASGKGQNYLFNWDKSVLAGDYQFTSHSFITDLPMARMVAADFVPDGKVDVVMSALDLTATNPISIVTNFTEAIKSNDPISYKVVTNTHALALTTFSDKGSVLAIGSFPIGILAYKYDKDKDESKWIPWSAQNTLGSGSTSIAPEFAPYDLLVTDLNSDQSVDIAIAHPYLGDIQIFTGTADHNFTSQPLILKLDGFPTSYALDSADFDFDGYPDLIAVGSKPVLFRNTKSITTPFTASSSTVIPMESDMGRVWAIRAADVNNDGSMDVAISSREHPAFLLANLAIPLAQTAYALPNTTSLPASSVIWGDLNQDGFQDLIYGSGSALSASSEALDAKLFTNSQQNISTNSKPFIQDVRIFENSGIGPHAIALGDALGKDNKLDIALATQNNIRLYDGTAGNYTNWSQELSYPNAKMLAWGDMTGDGWLDLAASNGNNIVIFANHKGTIASTPLTITLINSVTALAWGDFDNDNFLDLVVTTSSGPAQILLNQGGDHFDAVALPSSTANGTAVASASFDGDRWLDLAIGTIDKDKKKIILIPSNGIPLLNRTSLGTSASHTTMQLADLLQAKVTSLAWGDADNDHDLDLAVGYDGAPLQVYVNLQGNLILAWQSPVPYSRSTVAWGDADHDGDLDLAFSQDSNDVTKPSGYFENRYVVPRSSTADEPTSVWIVPNDTSGNSTAYATTKILSGPTFNTETKKYVGKNVTITFEFAASSAIAANQAITILPDVDTYQFSLDGGNSWQRATEVTTPTIASSNTNHYVAQFEWNAFADQAISDDARFRVQIIHPHPAIGPARRASTSSISPSFRVRAVNCLWPTNPLISKLEVNNNSNPPQLRLEALYDRSAGGSGSLVFTWMIQDSIRSQNIITRTGQRVTEPILFTSQTHEKLSAPFQVKLTVEGEKCPIARPASIYTTTTIDLPPASIASANSLTATNWLLPQVSGFVGEPDIETNGTRLRWDTDTGNIPIAGFRIYASSNQTQSFELLATLPSTITDYLDPEVSCGRTYYVTTFNDVGESSASIQSYDSGDCR